MFRLGARLAKSAARSSQSGPLRSPLARAVPVARASRLPLAPARVARPVRAIPLRTTSGPRRVYAPTRFAGPARPLRPVTRRPLSDHRMGPPRPRMLARPARQPVQPLSRTSRPVPRPLRRGPSRPPPAPLRSTRTPLRSGPAARTPLVRPKMSLPGARLPVVRRRQTVAPSRVASGIPSAGAGPPRPPGGPPRRPFSHASTAMHRPQLARGAQRSRWAAVGEFANEASYFIPGVGTARSVYDTGKALYQGRYGDAGASSLLTCPAARNRSQPCQRWVRFPMSAGWGSTLRRCGTQRRGSLAPRSLAASRL